MKIIIVGASGTIGSAAAQLLGARHDVVRVGRNSGDVRCDMTDIASIDAMYDAVGAFDALVCVSGSVVFAPLADMTPEKFAVGLNNKLMGQVNLVMRGLDHMNDKGSFSLTSGLLSEDVILEGVSSAICNAGVDAFVRSSALSMPRGIRINSVSATLVEESAEAFAPYFPGIKPIPASEAALGYVKSVEGWQTGRVYRIGWSPAQI